jgi:uncharacterized protein (DUF433 family)
VKAWLKKHNLPTEVLRDDYDELNKINKSIRHNEKKFRHLNIKLKERFDKLDKEKINDAIKVANETNMKNFDLSPNFEQVMF